MVEKIYAATHAIATAVAWKLFVVAVAVTGLMVGLMPITRFGFVLALIASFGWLFAMNVELEKANEIGTRRSKFASAVGLLLGLSFAFPEFLGVVIPREFGVLYFVFSGVGMLGCMLYLGYRVGPLLAKLEAKLGIESRISASVLLWFWLVGVWFLQPRLRKALGR